jgi:hypothetical protein
MLSNAFPRVSVSVKPLQLLNAFGSMLVTELGMVSEPLKPLHPQKAEVPMEVTALLMVKPEKPVHL